jgi:hypothetical protein
MYVCSEVRTKAKMRVAPYAADHGRGNKAVLTNVNGHSGDELHCRTRPDFTDHRPKSNEFFSGSIRQCCWFCEHFVVCVLCSAQRMVDLEKLISFISKKKP